MNWQYDFNENGIKDYVALDPKVQEQVRTLLDKSKGNLEHYFKEARGYTDASGASLFRAKVGHQWHIWGVKHSQQHVFVISNILCHNQSDKQYMALNSNHKGLGLGS